MFSSLVWLQQHSTMPHKFVQTGLLEEVSEYQLQYPQSCNSSQESRTATLRIGLPCEISAPHWTTLGGQSNSMALETPGTFFFFFFPKRSCSCFARAGGGEGKTSALAFMERRPARTKSSPKREALVGGGEREQRRLPQTRNTHARTRTGARTKTRQTSFNPAVWWPTSPSRLRPGEPWFSTCASSVNNVTIKSLGR